MTYTLISFQRLSFLARDTTMGIRAPQEIQLGRLVFKEKEHEALLLQSCMPKVKCST